MNPRVFTVDARGAGLELFSSKVFKKKFYSGQLTVPVNFQFQGDRINYLAASFKFHKHRIFELKVTPV
jgi:hypothetical protein